MPTEHFKKQYIKELPKKYNPQNTSREVLKKTFTIRLKEYKKIWADISQATMSKPEEHYIIQGVRGSGKTTLLTRLSIAIEEDKKLSKKLITVLLKEEEYGVSTLFSFWLRIAEDLEEHYEYASLFTGLVDDIESLNIEEGEEAKSAFKLINKRLKDNKKKIILLVDNIVELFDNFSGNEKEILREVLSQNNNLRIIGGSAIALESFYDHKDPFYQFFKVVTLKQLTKSETINLLKTLGKVAGKEESEKINAVIKNEPEKIESIRRLTGGIPRTIVLLFEILADGPKGSTFKVLDETLDMASPIYKHRMDDLTKQQKPIVHAIAQHWDAISAKEIAKKTRLTSKNISAQLAQLQKLWIIEPIKTDTKNNLYRLQERFFNIWYLMRYGARRDRRKMQWLTQFLEVWCTPEELVEKARNYSKELGHDIYLPGAQHYAKALMATSSLRAEEKEAVYDGFVQLCSENGENDFVKGLPEIGGSDYSKQAKEYYDKKEYLKAIDSLGIAAKKGVEISYLNLGYLYAKYIKDYAKAERAYQQGIDKGYAQGYLNLGNLYKNRIKDYEKAEIAYKQAIDKGDERAYVNLGNLYANDIKDYEKSEIAYQQAIDKSDERCYFNLGYLYANKLKDYEKAEIAYQQAIGEGDKRAYHNLGALYMDNLKDYEKAEVAYQQAIDEGVKRCYFSLGYLYTYLLKDYEKAEVAYQKAIGEGDERAYLNLGALYADKLKDYEKAEVAYQQAISEGDEHAYLNLGALYADKLKDSEKAEITYQQAIEKNTDGSLNALSWMFFEHILKNKKKDAMKLASKSIESDKGFGSLHTFISIALWNSKLEVAEKHIHDLLIIESWKKDEWEQKNLIDLFLLFLAKGQTNLVDRLLKEYQLTDILKPLYYTLMHLMKDKYPNEYLRMGSEMQETVDEMLSKVEQLREKYA